MLAFAELDEDSCIVLFEEAEIMVVEAEIDREDYIVLLKLSVPRVNHCLTFARFSPSH
jgi:hypothetical protein